MSSVTPSPGKIYLLDGATQIKGVESDSISDETKTDVITNDCDTAERRAPILDDGSYNFTFVYDSTPDTGQGNMFTKKAAKTAISFTRYLTGTTGPNYTFTGYVSKIEPQNAVPGKALRYRVTVDVTDGMTYSAS